jgi:formate hydrogenlyase subunit 6/NADH:ubiquinone oxidoreductase subunit I
MSVAERLRQVVRPILVAARHVLFKPYTYKYPYEEVPNLPSENYRFDPKLGIAFPGIQRVGIS